MPRQSSKFFSGNLTKDPELGYTPAGKAVLKLDFAENDADWDRQAKEHKDVPATFYQVTLWGDMAERTKAWATKGLPIIVYGRLRFQTFAKRDGGEGYALTIIPDSFGPDARYLNIGPITRVPRQGGQQGGYDGQQQQQPQGDPWGGGQRQGVPADDPWGSAPAPGGLQAPAAGGDPW